MAIVYHDSPALEWVLYFRNAGTADAPILEDVQAMDFEIEASPGRGEFALHYAEGSHEKITDFQPREKIIAPGDTIRLSSFGGRSSDGILPLKTTEANMLKEIESIAQHKLPVDTWWIDAGWYTCRDNWARYVGNVDPDPVRFPRGLHPVADAAHRAGMRFLLWFEPERVMPDTWLFQNHPEWLLKPSADMPAELKYQINDRFYLLDMGHPQALAWLKQKTSEMIGRTGVNCYRNDFNMYPVYYWRNALAADYDSSNPKVWQDIARAFREEQLLRHLYAGDYYPLSPYSTAGNAWMAWQFDRPDLGQGLVQAFRRSECTEETATWRLRGLDESAEYVVTDLDQPGSVKRTGRDLLRTGLTVRLRSRPAAAVCTYQKR